jgi:cyclic pyranopterin phosphate synthase
VGNLNGWKPEQVVPADEIVERINAELPIEPIEGNYRGEVARRYRYQDDEGEIGVIASMTQPFCGDCTRIRLSADGKVYTCLFASFGQDLKKPLRKGATDQEMDQLISNLWQFRTDRYSEERAWLQPLRQPKVEMYHIGG